MNLLDPHAYDDALAALSVIPKPRRVMVQITMEVPIDDLDLSGCTINRYTDTVEFWGGRFPHTVADVDLSGAKFAGFPCEISSISEDVVTDYLLERDSE